MRQHQGQFVFALLGLAALSITLLLVRWDELAGYQSKVKTPVSSADRALMELALERYSTLARNMTQRIEAAERAVAYLQEQQQEALARTLGRGKRMAALKPFQPSSVKGTGTGSEADTGGTADPGPEASGADPSSGTAMDGLDDEEPEETEEEREKRLEGETKLQNEMLQYDPTTNTVKQRWRPDFKCGERVPPLPLPDKGAVECDPAGEAPCCSSLGWCGKSALHCTCEVCADYSTKVTLKVASVTKKIRERECGDIAFSFGAIDTPEECAQQVLVQPECGRYLMFSHTYPAWGCRCCAAGSGESDDAKANWDLYLIEVTAVPKN